MKKLLTLLLLFVTFSNFKSIAQNTTNCNAAFDVSISGLTVKFTAATTNDPAVNQHYWNFGDGKISSDISPVHLYATAGAYTVKHIVYRGNSAGIAECKNTVEKRIEVSSPSVNCNLQAKFSFERDPLQQNKVKFTNLSTPTGDIHSVKWSFGDGTYSTDLNPTHVYATSGLYMVCLIIEKDNTCKKDVCMQLQVQVPSPAICNLEPKFEWYADVTNKNKIYFRNTTLLTNAAIRIVWNFGDGSTSSSPNPDHIYAHAGKYTVCLKIYVSSVCYKEICKTIEVKEPEINCHELSKFNIIRSTANCLEFKFAPVNANPNWKYLWSFGDGTTSTDVAPSHVYQRSGNYTVKLTVSKGADCSSSSHKIAETGNCFTCHNIWAKFEFRRESTTSNKFYFHAISNAPIQFQTWTITKLSLAGSTPIILNQINPSYTFEPGEYRVCVRVVTAGGCVKEYCQVISIPLPYSQCNLTAYPNPSHNQVTVAVQLTQPLMMHFYLYNSVNNLLVHKEQQGNTGNNTMMVNIENLLPGWYTIKVISGNRICYTRFQKT